MCPSAETGIVGTSHHLQEAITMRSVTNRGRVYRRCGCRDAHRHQLGTHCPRLTTDSDHGSWTFAVDLPSPDHHRTTIRRGGFPTQNAAQAALQRILEGEAGGFNGDPNQTVTDYLSAWVETKAYVLKPTTLARYRDYVTGDLIPALGALKLDELGHRHIAGFVHTQLAAGRGRVTVYRCLATLSSALGDAVRQHRLTHNPARPAVLPRPPTAERRIWTAEEATRFLRYCHHTDPLIADVCELLIGTGMRKGEALALHWHDVHLNEEVLYVHYTLSAINNARLVITSPKTRSSKNWVAISPRVAAALTRRAAEAPDSALFDRSSGPFTGLVFCRPDGRPLRPQTVLDRFRRRAKEAGVPRITLHDLRHLAATLSITAGTPLTVVSKTLRHSTLSTTANLYSHLTQQAAHDAVDAIDTALAQADPTADSHAHWPAWLRPHRDHPNGHRARLTLPYFAAPAASSPSASTPQGVRATTMRPPRRTTRKRPLSHLWKNGLRPAKTLVGTTGFEPATP
ncbi:tyrosine-type recombinase/integrase [Streptomyces malaysiensis]|uniref:tyrosine-type recombinase/integrase n=2 Tax=Streptomyces malaysiensis TaxID=92644 RepID=UPI002075D427|nr:tyrosine-type recombinase/integrase [Streptomyces malaysiensis]